VGFFKVRDPVTGSVYSRSDWRIQRQSRNLYAEFYYGGPATLPEWPDIDDYGRNRIALFLAHWGSEGHPEVNKILDILLTMDARDIYLLVNDVPLDRRSRKHPLPAPADLASAIQHVPPDPDSEKRHRWRLDLRMRELQQSLEHIPGKAEALRRYHYTDTLREEVAAKIAAGYCGSPSCRFCEESG
jgi:hypothetical protein